MKSLGLGTHRTLQRELRGRRCKEVGLNPQPRQQRRPYAGHHSGHCRAAVPVFRDVRQQGELRVGVGVLPDRPDLDTLIPDRFIPALDTPEGELVIHIGHGHQDGRVPLCGELKVGASVLVEAGQSTGRLPRLPQFTRRARERQSSDDSDAPDCGAGPRAAIRPGVQRRVPGFAWV